MFTKVSSTDPSECFRKLRIKKVIYIVIITALIGSFAMEIIDKLDVADKYMAF